MKKQLFILSVILVLFSSCEKVIHVDLNSADPKYVIEADLFEGTHPFRVHVAKTTDYFGTQPQEQVSDAIVVLKDQAGNITPVPISGNGWYEAPSVTATSGNTYQLSVTAGGKEFTAFSTMPGVVTIDSITYEYKDGGFQDPGYRVFIYFNDPGGIKNYYRMLITQNDTFLNRAGDLYLDNDKFNDGKLVKEDPFDRYRKGDSLVFELRTMDEKVYDFYTTLNDVLNNQGGPAPANPNTNIQGGALGYFGAFTSSKKGVKLPF